MKIKCAYCLRRNHEPPRPCKDIVDLIDNAIEGDETCMLHLMETEEGKGAMETVYAERRRNSKLEMG